MEIPHWSRLLIGAIVNLEIWIMLALNIICLTCIYRGKLHKSKDTPVYLISGFNLISETSQLIVHMIYVGPAIISGSWLFSGQSSIGVLVFAILFLGLWFFGSLFQILMAVSRMCVVCFPGRAIFTQTVVYWCVFFAFCTACGMVAYSEIISPCCKMTPDPDWFGYSYLLLENQTNYSMDYVDLPIDLVTSGICIFSYVTLVVYVTYMGRRHNVKSSKRELRLCLQFVIIYLAYNTTWLSFFIFPKMGFTHPETFAITTFLFVANCGMNSIIYLTMNQEIRHQFRLLFNLPSTVEPYHSSNATTLARSSLGPTTEEHQ